MTNWLITSSFTKLKPTWLVIAAPIVYTRGNRTILAGLMRIDAGTKKGECYLIYSWPGRSCHQSAWVTTKPWRSLANWFPSRSLFEDLLQNLLSTVGFKPQTVYLDHPSSIMLFYFFRLFPKARESLELLLFFSIFSHFFFNRNLREKISPQAGIEPGCLCTSIMYSIDWATATQQHCFTMNGKLSI